MLCWREYISTFIMGFWGGKTNCRFIHTPWIFGKLDGLYFDDAKWGIAFSISSVLLTICN